MADWREKRGLTGDVLRRVALDALDAALFYVKPECFAVAGLDGLVDPVGEDVLVGVGLGATEDAGPRHATLPSDG